MACQHGLSHLIPSCQVDGPKARDKLFELAKQYLPKLADEKYAEWYSEDDETPLEEYKADTMVMDL